VTDDRKSSILAGALLLAGIGAGIMSVVPSVEDPEYLLLVSSNEHEVLRGAFFQFLMAPAYVGFALALYPALRRRAPALALGFVGLRFIAAAFIIFAAVSLPLFVILSRAFVQAGAPESSHFQTIGELMRTGRDLVNHVAMIVSVSLGGLILYALLFRLRLVPRWLAVWGLVATVLAIAASLSVLFGMVPVISPIYLGMNAPIAVHELVFAVVLIAKGLDTTPRV
jgi:hypothetical protein